MSRQDAAIKRKGPSGCHTKKGIKDGFSDAMKDLMKKVNSQSFVLFGWESSLYIWPKSGFNTQPTELQANSSCKSLVKLIPIEVNDYLKKISKKKSVKVEPLKVINLELLFELTRPDVIETVTVHNDQKSRIHFKLTLPVDVVIFAHPDDQWIKTQEKIVEAVSEQLLGMDQCIQKYTKGKNVPIPQAFHFELPESTILTTAIYPAGYKEKDLEPQRKELHDKLGLGDKPYLRRPMSYDFPNDDLLNKYVKTVHKYIPIPSTEEFEVYVVHGSYTFHHYLQDDINDSGWGCAYRSLQTIISWFNCQGYIDIPIPTHETIQKMLVTAGDKGPSGEPLAHTLLGVAWNEETGAVKFLILDAHYSGEDDWANIVERAIDWKDEDFWDQMEPYNICLPQRPQGI
ncbi:hypothetical protein scyTo_0004357 [Scyliorhinus torazame]|uniref:Ufm1-specific protease 2 n=1 Tax=Scyliorhinus torazame TaxID=75743 RepID=A0A401NQE7_SCYTO|nr:hypothetical protein [Scyliorhinus torazame]